MLYTKLMENPKIQIPNMLMIGGASRNVGKTSLTSEIIRKISLEHSIVGIKIKTLYDGDNFFHGKDRSPLTENENFRITEETSQEGAEDTSKMLQAGAKRVFKIKVKSQFIEEALETLKAKISETDLFVCESNSLRTVAKPGLFLMIKHKEGGEMKPSAKKLEKFADKVIFTDGQNHEFDINSLKARQGSWEIGD